MNNVKEYFKLWKHWQKHSLNGKFVKLCVLLGIAHSPTFELMKVCNWGWNDG